MVADIVRTVLFSILPPDLYKDIVDDIILLVEEFEESANGDKWRLAADIQVLIAEVAAENEEYRQFLLEDEDDD